MHPILLILIIDTLTDCKVLTVALVCLGVTVSASSSPHLFRRQFGSCQTECAWATGLANCGSTDVACVCNVFTSAGTSEVNSCATCLQSSDASVASDIQQLAQACSQGAGSGAGAGSTGDSVTTNPTATAGGGSSGSDPCATLPACVTVTSAVSVCSDDACFCPTALPFFAACASCYQTVNATSASDLLQASSICSGESFTAAGAATPTATSGPQFAVGACSAACSQIDAAITSCTDDACFCPTLLAAGSGCSACWATVNATDANLISSGMAGCATEFASTTGAALGATGAATGHATSNTAAATTTKSAATYGPKFDVFSPVHGIMLIAFVAGVLTFFG